MSVKSIVGSRHNLYVLLPSKYPMPQENIYLAIPDNNDSGINENRNIQVLPSAPLNNWQIVPGSHESVLLQIAELQIEVS
jgi:hypothetical protein